MLRCYTFSDLHDIISYVHCFCSYSKTTSPTNLREHLSNKHKIELLTTKSIDKHQRTLTDVFCSVVKKKVNPKDEQQILARRIVLWFCRDLLPYLAVAGVGFQDFWKSLNIKTKLPDESTLRRGALDDMYLCLKRQLIEKLKTIPKHATIGIDSWTDKFKHITYNTVSLHYIENHQRLSIVLKTGPFPPPHDAQNFKNYLNELLTEYGLQNMKQTEPV